MCCKLGESCSKEIDGGLGFILFVVANTKDAAESVHTPGLACDKAGKEESG